MCIYTRVHTVLCVDAVCTLIPIPMYRYIYRERDIICIYIYMCTLPIYVHTYIYAYTSAYVACAEQSGTELLATKRQRKCVGSLSTTRAM